MIKNNKKQILITSIIIMLPVIIGLLLWNRLPEHIATHWGADGEADGWSGRAFAVFGLPMLMLGFHWICVWVTAIDPGNKNQSKKVFGMLLWIFPLISLIMNGAVYAIALGYEIGMDIAVRVLLGLMFIILGNYMPKCKQNHTIGIKVTWALRSEENWNKTHRFAGKVWVVGGILLLLTMFVPLENFMYAFLGIILVLSFMPMVYSYVYYRKQKKAGFVTEEAGKATPMEKRVTIIATVIAVGILIGVAVLMFTGDFTVRFEESAFRIEAGYWEDITVSYADIDFVEYRGTDEPGIRTYGFGSAKLLMGNFENEEFGDYTRYSYVACDSCIVLTVDDKILVFNGTDEESTQEIYDELTRRIGQ